MAVERREILSSSVIAGVSCFGYVSWDEMAGSPAPVLLSPLGESLTRFSRLLGCERQHPIPVLHSVKNCITPNCFIVNPYSHFPHFKIDQGNPTER